MSDIAVKVENLSKQYHIARKQKGSKTIKETLLDAFISPFRKMGKILRGEAGGASELDEMIWALKDISFEVKKGEVLGIIGRNGSGKSTLLKILSRITEPTEGHAEFYGRIGSLLEVGTGFQPELSGRDNIFLNGAILGMKRREINSKFDEIVAFSEIDKFIDTPVKHYSSGMYMRLAFAVAAHFEPEILLVDEVLAVGDISFQKKCMGKMNEVAKEGRTILFVSHNMGAIANLCKSAIWLEVGNLKEMGDVGPIINAYLKNSGDMSKINSALRKRHCTGDAAIKDVRLFDSARRQTDIFRMGESVFVEFDVETSRLLPTLDMTLEIKRTEMGMNVVHMMNHDCGFFPQDIPAGKHTFRVEIPNCMLYPTSYSVSVWIGTNGAKTGLDLVIDAANFSMVQSEVTRRMMPLSQHTEAIFYVQSKWEKL